MNTHTCSPRFSSSSTNIRKYDVFLSFRGPDAREGFASDLYKALVRKGVHVYMDNVQLKMGDKIAPELWKAIEESRVSVVVLSRNYASSSWCLDELVHILKCDQQNGLKILPVFYGVEPCQVRWQSGDFGEDFVQYVTKYKYDTVKVNDWKNALKGVADISGWESNNRTEAEMIQKLVVVILKLLPDTSSYKDHVGLDGRLKEIYRHLDLSINDVRVIGLCGMGGVGKTTIAQAIFEQIKNKFEASCFVDKVKEKSQKHGLVYVQKLLLESLLESTVPIQTCKTGRDLLRKRLCSRRVFIVLDDVDNLQEIEELVGKGDDRHQWIGLSSRVIITTRDERLLKTNGVNKVYKVDRLSSNEALQLLHQKAFNKNTPSSVIEDYSIVSQEILKYAGGLPLALKVLGSSLHGRTVSEWMKVLDRLKRMPDKDISNSLKVSFDGLDDEEKKMFLDIACFFKGAHVDEVKIILESFFHHPEIGIDVLVCKSLITIDEHKSIQLHDLLWDMAVRIVKEECPTNPGKRSRLWDSNDALEVLKHDKGTETLEAIALPCVERSLVLKFNSLLRMPELRFLRTHGARLENFHLSEKPVELSSLRVMEKLIVIDLSECNMNYTPDFKMFPKLEILILFACKNLLEVHKSVEFAERLTCLELSNCENLKTVPRRMSSSLRKLYLGGCSSIKEFPKLEGNMENLSDLSLYRTAIRELSMGIGHLTGLTFLNVSECSDLISISGVSCLTSLVTLDLSSCKSLKQLPENIGNLKHLERLNASRSSIRKVPCSIVLLVNLKELNLESCKGVQLPKSFSGLISLECLNLKDCNLGDGAIPDDIGSLSSLKTLDLSRNNFGSIPESISRLSLLQTLGLSNCSNLLCLPKDLPSSLKHLYTLNCPLLATCLFLWTCADKGDALIKCLVSKDEYLIRRELPHKNSKDHTMLFPPEFIERQMSSRRFFKCIMSPLTEVPKWCTSHSIGSCVAIEVPKYLSYPSCSGLMLCVVSQVLQLDNVLLGDDGYSTLESTHVRKQYTCEFSTDADRPPLRPLVLENLRSKRSGSYGIFIYIPIEWFEERMWAPSRLNVSVASMNDSHLRVIACGAHFISWKPMTDTDTDTAKSMTYTAKSLSNLLLHPDSICLGNFPFP